MLDLTTPHPKRAMAQKPWPDRDWDAMPGVFLDRKHLQAMEGDPLHRDVYTLPQRLEAWDYVNRWHMWARKHNRGTPPDTSIFFVSADMGQSKSHLMIGIAMLAWMFQAVPVFSVQSVGAMFGYRISYKEMYAFADVLPLGSILIVDEISALMDGYTARANRGRTLNAGMTSFRKGGNLMLTATATEAQTGWQLRSNVKGVIKPRRLHPTREEVLMYDSAGRPLKTRTVPLRKGELKYPEFCYVRAGVIRVPWIGKRVFDDAEREIREANQRRRRSSRHEPKYKIEPVNCPAPFYMDLAAKLYDTFESVPVSDAYDIDAEAMREDRELRKAGRLSGKEGGDLEDAVNWAMNNRVFIHYSAGGGVPLDDVLAVMTKYNRHGFRDYNPTRLRRDLLSLYGPDACTKRRVNYGVFNGDLERVGIEGQE